MANRNQIKTQAQSQAPATMNPFSPVNHAVGLIPQIDMSQLTFSAGTKRYITYTMPRVDPVRNKLDLPSPTIICGLEIVAFEFQNLGDVTMRVDILLSSGIRIGELRLQRHQDWVLDEQELLAAKSIKNETTKKYTIAPFVNDKGQFLVKRPTTIPAPIKSALAGLIGQILIAKYGESAFSVKVYENTQGTESANETTANNTTGTVVQGSTGLRM